MSDRQAQSELLSKALVIEGRGDTFAILGPSGDEVLAEVRYHPVDGLEPLETPSGQLATQMAAAPVLLDVLQDAKDEIENMLADLVDASEGHVLAKRTLSKIETAIALASRNAPDAT
ncbi:MULTISPECIES: hypothetical protein [Microvirga]|uniref:hypothetical protein n=1 Tax=Microvirga TaxID=186650 RepID=UPI0021C5AAD1|nr:MULTISPECIES: hypothetical protein [unclassified Microvirga]